MEEMNNQQPLEETPVCPEETAEPVTEELAEQPAAAEEAVPVEMKKGILLTPGKLVALIVTVVVLVAALAGAIVYGMDGFASNDDTAETTAPTEETVEPTYAADTGLNDVTHKGSYTVSDEEVVALADRVVATIGEDVLTVEDLQIHYWMQVQNFIYNYSYYLNYFGLDYTQPLDTQICSLSDKGYTWQQYFLEAALYNYHNYQAMSNASLAAGYQLTEENRAYLDSVAANLQTSALAQGYTDAVELLAYNVGPGADVDAYVNYEQLYLQGYMYYEEAYNAISTTPEDLEAFFAEHEAEYAESGITKDGIYVDVRHILVMPKGGTTDEEGNTTYSDEEWEACRVEAQAILDEWLAGEKTEESFAQLANTRSADSDGTDGGLYETVYEGQMVPNFNDWCFDESRQTGDYGLVQTEYGYHVMYFVSSVPIWEHYTKSDIITEKSNKIVTDACQAYPMEVDYSAIALGEVDIPTWFG